MNKRFSSSVAVASGLCALSLMGARPASAVEPVYPLVNVNVDGTELATRGLLMNGRTLLPVRELAVRLGGETRWDSHSKTVWASFPSQQRTARMRVNVPMVDIFEYDAQDPHKTGRFLATTRLDQPPVLLGGRVVAPVAAAADVAGAKVFWEPAEKIVYVESRAFRADAT